VLWGRWRTRGRRTAGGTAITAVGIAMQPPLSAAFGMPPGVRRGSPAAALHTPPSPPPPHRHTHTPTSATRAPCSC
jgi:hypothetical protein